MPSIFTNSFHAIVRAARLRGAALTLGLAICVVTIQDCRAQSALDIRGAMSLKISKGRIVFNVGEIANNGTPGLVSGRLELSVWLSKKPYSGSEPLKGARLAACRLDGIAGSEVVANVSCRAKLRLISRGTYYFVVTLSELDPSTEDLIERDFFTFSRRLKF